MSDLYICGDGHGSVGAQLGVVRLKRDFDGSWVAVKKIEAIFGAEVHGELQARGMTPAHAMRQLDLEEFQFYESLWV